MTLESLILTQKDYYVQTLESIRNTLRRMPEGTLRIEHNGKYVRWVWVTKKKDSAAAQHTYIPKKDREFASKLAYKTYLLEKGLHLKAELKRLEKIVSVRDEIIHPQHTAWKKLILDPAFRELLPPEALTMEEELAVWQTAEYPRSKEYPEHLTLKMSDGTYCRSKSELMISEELIDYGVPFRYENLTRIGNVNLYPDFTVRNRRTGKEFFWDHFGMMDNEDYFNGYTRKMRLYVSNGYLPGDGLITTFETSTQPLNIETIRDQIELYLL